MNILRTNMIVFWNIHLEAEIKIIRFLSLKILKLKVTKTFFFFVIKQLNKIALKSLFSAVWSTVGYNHDGSPSHKSYNIRYIYLRPIRTKLFFFLKLCNRVCSADNNTRVQKYNFYSVRESRGGRRCAFLCAFCFRPCDSLRNNHAKFLGLRDRTIVFHWNVDIKVSINTSFVCCVL